MCEGGGGLKGLLPNKKNPIPAKPTPATKTRLPMSFQVPKPKAKPTATPKSSVKPVVKPVAAPSKPTSPSKSTTAIKATLPVKEPAKEAAKETKESIEVKKKKSKVERTSRGRSRRSILTSGRGVKDEAKSFRRSILGAR